MGEERRPTPPQQHGHGQHGPGAPSSSTAPAPVPSTSAAGPSTSQPPRPRPHGPAPGTDFKLVADPMINRGNQEKMFRQNGVVLGHPHSHYNFPGPSKEPRRLPHERYDRYLRPEPLELPVPRFKIDINYVGVPPPLQVTITNINDNIDKNFLAELLLKYGAFEEMDIFFHPVTKKHLGIAHALFLTKRGATLAIEKLNNTSVMGQVLNVFVDPFKKKCKELVEEATAPVDKSKTKKVEAKKDEPDPSTTEGKKAAGASVSSSKHSKEKDAPAAAAEEDPRLHKPSSFDTYPPAPVTAYPPAASLQGYPQPVPAPMSMIPHPASVSAYYAHQLQAPLANSPPPPPATVPSPYSHSNGNDFDGVGVGVDVGSTAISNGAPAPEGGSPSSSQQQMDLDTRIKMMLSGGGAQFGAMLGACLSDDDGAGGSAAEARRSRLSLDKNDIWKPSGSDGEDDDPIELSHARKFKRNTFVPVDDEDSRPPSPFLAQAQAPRPLRLQNGVASGLVRLDGLDEVSDDSSEEDGDVFSTRKKDQDQELPMGEVPLPPDYEYHDPAAPPMVMTPEMQAYYQQYYTQTQTPDGKTPSDPYATPGSYPPTPGSGTWDGMDPAYAAYYGSFGGLGMPPPLPAEEDPSELDKPDLPELTPDEVLEAVEARLMAELKSIVRRDLHKKLIEQCAFKVVEDWCANKDRSHREAQANDRLAKLQQAGHAGGAMGGDAGGKDSDIFGLGFRATIPRMPSFRRQRSPSPRHGRRHGRGGSSDAGDDDQDRDRWQDDDEDSRSSFGGRRDGDRGRDQGRRHRRGHSLSSSGSRSVSVSGSSSDSEDEKDSRSQSSASASSSVSRSRSGSTASRSASANSGLDEGPARKSAPGRASDEEDSLSTVSSLEEDSRPPATKKEKTKEPSPPPGPTTKKSKAKRLLASPERRTPAAGEEMDVDVERLGDKPKKEPPDALPSKTKTFEPASAEVTALDHSYATLAPEPEPVPPPPSKGRGSKAQKAAAAAYVALDMKPEQLFPERSPEAMQKTIVEFLLEGIDAEDYQYIKQAYELSTGGDGGLGVGKELEPLLSKVRWVEHPVTKVDQKQKVDSWNRVNTTGSCRTEGFYRYTPEEKMAQKQQLIAKLGYEMRNKPASSISHSLHLQSGSKNQLIREARSHQRRLLTEFGDNESDLLRFNQLKFRKKDLRFARSYIHDWGLFAAEPIAADEMVIEYVGQVVRAPVSDCREKAYEKVGIMSSYLFRLDGEEGLVVDATKCGNLSRFINHSCNPNCIAKTISVEGEKKIVIYSKQEIAVDEEITYDYKFPLEDTKIKCLCGAYNCRGYLN